MKYLEIHFHINPFNVDALDLLAALASDAGLESFVNSFDGIIGYARTDVFDGVLLDSVIADFPIEGISIKYTKTETEDKDWNEEWEKNGFKPVVVADKILIHSSLHPIVAKEDYEILINPRLAFGTGSHQTTSLILEMLLQTDLKNKSFLDAGCGTGILAIFASMRGSSDVFAYDIDSWSVKNTIENAALNNVFNLQVVQGDSSVLIGRGPFDIIVANINRNVLLANMNSFANVLNIGGKLFMSGFLEEDLQPILDKAESIGLSLKSKQVKDGWVATCFEK